VGLIEMGSMMVADAAATAKMLIFCATSCKKRGCFAQKNDSKKKHPFGSRRGVFFETARQ
jgi:hypothetical protein